MKKLNKTKVITVLAAVPLLSIFFYPATSSAAGPVIHQGTTSSFAVLAATGITVTTSASITGTAGSDIGSTSASITGPVPSPVGTVHAIGDSSTTTAQTHLTTAVGDVNGATPVTALGAGDDLTGRTLVAGNYSGGAVSLSTGSVTFNGQGDPNAIFIIKAASSFVSASGTTMNLINGAQACNVFWTLGTSATLGSSSLFLGHLYAAASITANTGTTVHGNLLAQTGAVTLNVTTIVNDNCAPAVVATPAPAPMQTSKITSVAPANCVLTGTTAVTINGVFPTLVTNVSVDGKIVALGSWTQTGTTVTVNAVTSSTVPTIIQLYNGQAPVLAAQNFTCAPGAVVVPIPPVVIIPPGTGTIHVIKIVDNAYGGTATAADFSLSLRHHGADVLGSPDVGMSAPGRTYVLAPGTYVLGEAASAAFPNYISSFDIVGQSSNVINLKSGDDLTITETNTELPAYAVATPAPTPTPPHTVTGGKLPKTGSPWYNLLLMSAGLVLLGGFVALFGKKTLTNK